MERGSGIDHNSVDRKTQSLTGKFLRNHKQLVALWGFRMKSLVDGEMLLLQGENLIALDIGEGYITKHHQRPPPHRRLSPFSFLLSNGKTDQRTKTLQITDPFYRSRTTASLCIYKCRHH